jgi:hypothetical protein
MILDDGKVGHWVHDSMSMVSEFHQLWPAGVGTAALAVAGEARTMRGRAATGRDGRRVFTVLRLPQANVSRSSHVGCTMM